MSKYRLSKRLVTQLMKDVYGVPISLGSVSNAEERVSHSLEQIYVDIKTRLQQAPVVHVDETGYKQKNKSGWAWLLASSEFTLFHLNCSRGKKVAMRLLGNLLDKTVVSDRYAAYNFISPSRHQVCWAHLKRDFQKISERNEPSGSIGRALLKNHEDIFSFWKEHGYKGYYVHKKVRKRLRYLKNKLRKSLIRGTHCSYKMTRRTCQNILDYEQGLWLFFEKPGVSPTNNLAEQQLRPLVISKKLSFGVQSERGARFIERIFSLVMSCKQQNKNPLEVLQLAIRDFFITPPPALPGILPLGAC